MGVKLKLNFKGYYLCVTLACFCGETKCVVFVESHLRIFQVK